MGTSVSATYATFFMIWWETPIIEDVRQVSCAYLIKSLLRPYYITITSLLRHYYVIITS